MMFDFYRHFTNELTLIESKLQSQFMDHRGNGVGHMEALSSLVTIGGALSISRANRLTLVDELRRIGVQHPDVAVNTGHIIRVFEE